MAKKDSNEQLESIPPEEEEFEKKKRLKIRHKPILEFMSEFMGTALMITIGIGTVAQVVLSDLLAESDGGIISIAGGFGIGVMLGVIVTAKASGGHINPAVSVAFAVFKKLTPWYKCIYYMAAQYLGAFVGSFIVYLVYFEAFHEAGIDFETSKIFATHPGQHIGLIGVIVDEIVGTAILLIAICAITDRNNLNIPPFVQPLMIGLTVYALVTGFSFNSGAALNPARDFGPRLFTLISGWGLVPFTHSSFYWITILVSTHIGAILGISIYKLMIGHHLSPPKDMVVCV